MRIPDFVKASLILVFAVVISSNSIAEQKYGLFRAPLSDHYPDNNVYCMFEDSKGIVWYGTMFGLIMSDGSNYFRFRYDPNDTNSISNDDVISIFEDRGGHLWFGTYYGGLNSYDRKSGRFTRYVKERGQISDNTVWSIAEDKQGVLWIGTESGLEMMVGAVWKSVNFSGIDTMKVKISSLEVDDSDNLFVGTQGAGLYILEKNRNEILYSLDQEPDEGNFKARYIRSLFNSPGKGVYVGTYQRGAFFISNASLKERRVNFENILPSRVKNDTASAISVIDITNGYGNEILFGTTRGVYEYDIAVDSAELLYKNLTPGSRNEYNSLLTPGNGTIFVSNYDDALYELIQLPGNSDVFISSDESGTLVGNISGFAESEGRLFCAGMKGLYELKGNTLIHKELDGRLDRKSILSIAADHSGRLWAATFEGLFCLTPANNGFDIKNVFNDTPVNRIDANTPGIIYAATLKGILKIDAAEGKIVKTYSHDPGDKNSLSENFVTSIFSDKKGDLWAGTFAGLNLLKSGSESFIRYSKILNDKNSLINNYVYSIAGYEDKTVFGTAGGLSVFDGTKFMNYTTADGLPDQVINALMPSGNNLIVGANFGVYIFDINNGSFALMKEIDEIINPASAISHNDAFLFGTKNGVLKVNASKDYARDPSDDFIFSRIEYEHGGKDISKDLTDHSSITLPHDASNLKIFYSASGPGDAESVSYYYTFDKSKDIWSSIGTVTNLDIRKLEPGESILQFRVVTNNGRTFDAKRTLTIDVIPPFYMTWYFYAFVVILLTSVAYLIYRLRLRYEMKRALELERAKEEERERVRYEASRDYHDELGHKLTRISIYSRNLLKEIEQQKHSISKELNKIMETSASLRESARDLIWSMDPGEDTLYDLVIRIKDFAEDLVSETDINLTVTGISEEYRRHHLSMDQKRNILLIAKEAVNNSVKYSGAEEMKITFTISGLDFEMKISDSGKGFVLENAVEGFGLKNMRARGGKLGAVVSIESKAGQGTTVSVSLKLKEKFGEYSLN